MAARNSIRSRNGHADFPSPARPEWPRLAMVRLGHRRIGFQFADQIVVGLGLLPRQINVEDEQRNEPHDGHVVGRRTNLPKLSPIHNCSLSRTAPPQTMWGRGFSPLKSSEARTVFVADSKILPSLARHGRVADPSLHQAEITSSAPSLPTPAPQPPVPRFCHLSLPARSAQSSAPKPQSGFRCNARCKPQQRVRVHDRTAQQAEAHVVVRCHSQHVAERTFISQARRGTRHIRSDRDRPETELIVWQQISGEREQQGEYEKQYANIPVELARLFQEPVRKTRNICSQTAITIR